LLARALPLIAHPAIRARGTLGGSIAHADPAAELPAVALALDAELVVESAARGRRAVPAADFFIGFLSTAVEPDELLVEITLPSPPAGAGVSFQEVARNHGAFAIVGAAAMVQVTGGTVADARLVFTGAGGTGIRARGAEAALVGQPAGDESFRAAAEAAGGELDPVSDVHASADYRRRVGVVLARRALQEAAKEAAA
jgi:CO/xanthine dehydrogenase FAD-binding subunit